MPPLGVELDTRQKIACLHRMLARIGFNENMAGHVTVAEDGTEQPLGEPVGQVVGRGAGLRRRAW